MLYLPKQRAWTPGDSWASINEALRTCVRLQEGRDEEPGASVLDGQGVKSDGHGGEVGYDAGKCIKGRTSHLLVDMLGLCWESRSRRRVPRNASNELRRDLLRIALMRAASLKSPIASGPGLRVAKRRSSNTISTGTTLRPLPV